MDETNNALTAGAAAALTGAALRRSLRLAETAATAAAASTSAAASLLPLPLPLLLLLLFLAVPKLPRSWTSRATFRSRSSRC